MTRSVRIGAEIGVSRFAVVLCRLPPFRTEESCPTTLLQFVPHHYELQFLFFDTQRLPKDVMRLNKKSEDGATSFRVQR